MNRNVGISLLIVIILGAFVAWLLRNSDLPDSETSRVTDVASEESGFEGTSPQATEDQAPKQVSTEEPESPPSLTPPMLTGIVSGDGSPIAGAEVYLFSVKEAEAMLDRMLDVVPSSGEIPDLSALVRLVRTELARFKAEAAVETSDEEGRYAFRDVDEGGQFIMARAKGWLFEFGDVVNLEADRTETHDIELLRGSRIRGRVVDTQGKPLPGLTVLAEYRPPGMPSVGRIVRKVITLVNGEFLRGPFEEQTDDLGEFDLISLPPGTYNLVATNPAGAETILPAVQTGTENVVIYFGTGAQLSGRLVDTDGIPVFDVPITL